MIANETITQPEMFPFAEDAVSRILPHIAATPLYARKLNERSLTIKGITNPENIRKIPFTYNSDIHSTSVFE